MTVNSREQAWKEADKLFPTDYIKDEQASERAGYPIYKSTADGNESWISDLGNRLEVNTIDSTWNKTTNIWIEEPIEEPKKRHTSSHMRHFYSDEWCRDEKARTQEQLQEIVRKIRESCDVYTIDYFEDYTCTIYRNENLGLRYWVKDEFGHISEIDEERKH